MIVFRVETEDGGGMYQGKQAPRYYPTCALRRHAPHGDPMLPVDFCGRRFGFQTLRHLIEWIANESWMMDLHHRGFRIAIYRTDDYRVGRLQSVFGVATLVSHLNLLTVWNEIAAEAFDE